MSDHPEYFLPRPGTPRRCSTRVVSRRLKLVIIKGRARRERFGVPRIAPSYRLSTASRSRPDCRQVPLDHDCRETCDPENGPRGVNSPDTAPNGPKLLAV